MTRGITETDMNRFESPQARRARLRATILKGLFLYALVPVLCLIFLAEPIGSAVRASNPDAYRILLAALGFVCLNWFVYALLRRKRPSLLVFAYGVCCLLLVTIIEYEALPAYYSLASTLAVIGGCLTLLGLFLLSYWFAARHTRPSNVIAVGLWITIGVLSFFMLYRVIRDFESRCVTHDTWITMAILAALVPAAFVYRIRSSVRGTLSRRRATGLAAGRIVQIIGETHLDRDDDSVTDQIVRVRYSVDGISYEARTRISGLTMRRFGKKAFVGREIPVHYDPENPGSGFTDPIDRHFFDQDPDPDENKEDVPE